MAPDGQRFERDVVHHPGAVSVVALTDTDEVVMVRQYRAAVDRELLEIPAGKRDVDGEPVELTARRELVEEVGYEAGSLEILGQFFNSPGFCDEHSYVFIARDLRGTQSDVDGIEEHHMTVEHIPLERCRGLIASGEIVDAKTIIGVLLALDHLGV